MIETVSRTKIGLVFCLIVAVNLGVKLLGVNYNQIALDEPFSIYHAQFSIIHIYHTLIEGNNPPLYEMFLHYWIQLFGIDAFWVRLPSVIFSSFASGFWFLAALYGMSFWYALGCAFLFTFSTQYIYFSHEARAYALLLMLLSACAYLLARLWNDEKSVGIILAAALVSALCIYVHYLAIIPVGLMAAYSAMRALKNKKLFIYLFSFVACLIPIGILVVNRLRVINESGLWGMKPSWTQLYGYLNIFLNGRITLAVVAVCLLFSGILYIRKKENILFKKEIFLVFIWGIIFGIGYISMFFVSYKHPIFIERYVQVIIPFFFLSLAALFSLLLSKVKFGKVVGVVVLLVFCAQVNLYPSNERNPKLVVEKTKEFLAQPNAKLFVFIYPGWYSTNFTYYFDEIIFSRLEQDFLFEENHIKAMGPIIPSLDTIPSDFNGTTSIRTPEDFILYVDAGEYFINGNHAFLELLQHGYSLEKKDSIDAQTTLYYLKLKQN